MSHSSRRVFIATLLRTATTAAVVGCHSPSSHAAPSRRCGPRTPENIEGPFFKPGAPRRSRLGPRTAPNRIALSGQVTDAQCRAIPNARLEFWQADASGAYDNRGFRFRATAHADAAGGYQLHTIVPGRYLNGRQYRPAHIHVKVHPPGAPPLTTQLYFPDDPYNRIDPWFDKKLVVRVTRPKSGPARGHFDFVVA